MHVKGDRIEIASRIEIFLCQYYEFCSIQGEKQKHLRTWKNARWIHINRFVAIFNVSSPLPLTWRNCDFISGKWIFRRCSYCHWTCNKNWRENSHVRKIWNSVRVKIPTLAEVHRWTCLNSVVTEYFLIITLKLGETFLILWITYAVILITNKVIILEYNN